MSTFVYTHHKADTGEIFYVGIGSNYRSRSKTARSDYWKRITEKHGRIVNIVADCENRQDALNLEVWLIAAWLDSAAELANHTSGGEVGHQFTQEVRQRMSDSLAAACKRPETIAKKLKTMATPGYRQNMSASIKAAQSKPGVREKINSYLNSEKAKAIISDASSIAIVRSDGVRFKSATQAAKAMGVTAPAIYSVLWGKTDTCRGYGWRLEDARSMKQPKTRVNLQRAQVTRSDGMAFDTISAAGRSVGLSEGAIRHSIQSGSKTGGYNWAYMKQRPVAGVSGRIRVMRDDGVTYDSGTHAALACGVSPSMISRVIAGKAKTAAGYGWARADS